MTRLLDLPPEAFAERLAARGGRAFVVTPRDGDRPRASADWLGELADFLGADGRDYHGHEAVFLEVGHETGTLFGAFIHSTVRGQAQGGLRNWSYDRLEDMLRDGLRLSLGMSRKCALAGLWWGGGKGIISRPRGEEWTVAERRARVYREYGRFVSGLRGAYVTAEDVGTTPEDIAEVFTSSRFTTCVPPELGGSGNPSPMTAMGVVCAMEAAWEHLGNGSLAGCRVVMQGAGNVAASMAELLLRRGVGRILVTDLSAERLRAVRARDAEHRVETRVVERGDVSALFEPCDILAPSALGGVLSLDTIPRIQAAVVCGAANNQLLDDRRDDAALAERGIVYVPDFVANRMGIVHCSNEQYGSLPDDPAITRHFDPAWEGSIQSVTRRVLERSRTEGTTTSQAAIALADEACGLPHPIWGHRGRRIVDGLVASGWGADTAEVRGP